MCNRYAGSGHTEYECFGNRNGLKYPCLLCKRRENITPLCPSQRKPTTRTNMNLCYAMKNVGICNLLPTMTLELKNGNKCRNKMSSGLWQPKILYHQKSFKGFMS